MSQIDVARHYAAQALNYDKSGHFQAASYFYLEATRVIKEAVRLGIAPASLLETADKYQTRADKLAKDDECALSTEVKSAEKASEDRVEFLLSEGLKKDEDGKLEEALKLYTQGVEYCLKCTKEAKDDLIRNKFRSLAKLALDRSENIKNVIDGSNLPEFPDIPHDDLDNVEILRDDEATVEPASKEPLSKPTSNDTLDPAEIKVLATTSKINALSFVPFLARDLNESFASPMPFNDKDGLLKLSEKQKVRLKGWMRPDEFCANPTLIEKIDSGTIKQNLVSDCSFVASLAISARYERRFNTPLITNIIYPQNKHGKPIYNPCGKYMVKLYLNGIIRKIIIDDRLPVGENGQLLCSYSQNKNELWVSLLEKAYMKVMGGYDFPGSNSNIDLNCLTGWIPERVSLKTKDFAAKEKDKLFEKLLGRFHEGHCLITLATGKLPESEQDRTGLVDQHAYAVLDLRKIDNKRLLLVKNPWTHLRWKGKYSEKDSVSWTPQLCKALDYNPLDAQQFDDGVFWIDYDSVCHFFDVFYINWNPKLFPFTYSLHSLWKADQGPLKDLYTISANPQFSLEVNNKTGVSAVWILLSRHIMDKADFADNKEYITVIVYKSGKKIHLPGNPPPLIDAARINSPHYLCQLQVKDPGVQKYTLVVAQYEKTTTIYYTLRVFSSTQFKLSELKSSYKFRDKIVSEWKGKTAGGCGNGASRDTVKNNPIIHVILDDGSDDNNLLIDLRGPATFSIGFEISLVNPHRKNQTFERKSSGIFRHGCTVLELYGIPSGIYSIQVMTFEVGQEGPFHLSCECSTGFHFKRVQ